MAPVLDADVDYYAILGVPKNATAEFVTASYRALAKSRHPDKNLNNPESTAAFQALQSAYETISDPMRRAVYDSSQSNFRKGWGTQDRHNMQQAKEQYAERQRNAEQRARERDEAIARERQIKKLGVRRAICTNDILEVDLVVRRLTRELKDIKDKVEKEAQLENECKSWWTYVMQPVHGNKEETAKQKRIWESERFHKIASKRVKESQLEDKKARLQRLNNILSEIERETAEIAAKKEQSVTEEWLQRIKAEQEIRRRAEQAKPATNAEQDEWWEEEQPWGWDRYFAQTYRN